MKLVHSKHQAVNRKLLALRSSNGLNVSRLGFTLIELLVVISIIALLVAAATVSWTNAQQKSRDSKRKTDLKTIQQALESYYQANAKYPPTSGLGIKWCTSISNSGYTDVYNALIPTYMQTLPKDPIYPSQTLDYFYYVAPDRQSYKLYSTLENNNDPEYSTNLLLADGQTDCAGYNTGYNYRVTNP